MKHYTPRTPSKQETQLREAIAAITLLGQPTYGELCSDHVDLLNALTSAMQDFLCFEVLSSKLRGYVAAISQATHDALEDVLVMQINDIIVGIFANHFEEFLFHPNPSAFLVQCTKWRLCDNAKKAARSPYSVDMEDTEYLLPIPPREMQRESRACDIPYLHHILHKAMSEKKPEALLCLLGIELLEDKPRTIANYILHGELDEYVRGVARESAQLLRLNETALTTFLSASRFDTRKFSTEERLSVHISQLAYRLKQDLKNDPELSPIK